MTPSRTFHGADGETSRASAAIREAIPVKCSPPCWVRALTRTSKPAPRLRAATRTNILIFFVALITSVSPQCASGSSAGSSSSDDGEVRRCDRTSARRPTSIRRRTSSRRWLPRPLSPSSLTARRPRFSTSPLSGSGRRANPPPSLHPSSWPSGGGGGAARGQRADPASPRADSWRAVRNATRSNTAAFLTQE